MGLTRVDSYGEAIGVRLLDMFKTFCDRVSNLTSFWSA